MAGLLFDATMEGLARALTLHERRHEVLASNLANIETPGFHARELDFADALRHAFDDASQPANAPAADPPAPKVIDDPAGAPRADGNTVDLDQEMAKLSANGMDYLALASILSRRITLLRLAIEENP
ncbi:MAG TPA: flagellar basal body rod protein FlgB [Candidatus Binatia bacterium]|nr:flagellar basal body rod protein FlgB [Candidatus Binatia bacterium]